MQANSPANQEVKVDYLAMRYTFSGQMMELKLALLVRLAVFPSCLRHFAFSSCLQPHQRWAERAGLNLEG